MADEVRRLAVALDTLFGAKEELRVLDAGCGRAFHLDLGRPAHVVGIDVSDEILETNRDVDERIRGDIQDYRFAPGSFDAIVCWHVLEHLPHPERALVNFAQAVKDDGLVVLAVPNLFSIKGLVTKLTPHRFHVWFYRTVLGRKQAGTGTRGPFPTYMRRSISQNAIERFAARNGMKVAYAHLYEAPLERELRERHEIIDRAWRIGGFLLKTLSFGKIEPVLCNSIIVLEKQAATEGVSALSEARPAATPS